MYFVPFTPLGSQEADSASRHPARNHGRRVDTPTRPPTEGIRSREKLNFIGEREGNQGLLVTTRRSANGRFHIVVRGHR